MDVNVYFSRVDKFEFTEELNVFDAFGISIYHGWLIDEQDIVTAEAVKEMAYNELLTKLVHHKNGDEVSMTEIAIDAFLRSTASQLTFAGLVALHETMKNNQLSVFFRNNHFSTILKCNDKLYLLVTDFGYADVPTVVWELLDDIAGYADIDGAVRYQKTKLITATYFNSNTEYVDSFFLLNAHPPPRSSTRESQVTMQPGTYCRPPEPPKGGAGIPVFPQNVEEVCNPMIREFECDGGMDQLNNNDDRMPESEPNDRVIIKVTESVFDPENCNESDSSLELIGDENDDMKLNSGAYDDFAMALRLQEELDSEHSRRLQEAEARDREAALQIQSMEASVNSYAQHQSVQQIPQELADEQEEILRHIRSNQQGAALRDQRIHDRDGTGREKNCIIS